MTISVLNYAKLPPEVFGDIAGLLSEQHSLKDLMSWALADAEKKFIPGIVKDVIVQDEFTHDVVVPWGPKLVLVYDTT